MLVSVVTVTYNSERTIRRMISSLVTYLGSRVGEILIIDNNSVDATVDILRRLESETPQVKVIQMKTNLGYNRAANEGAKMCKHAIILFINPDTWVTDASLAECCNWLVDARRIACCYPSVESKSRRPSSHATRVVVPFLIYYLERNDNAVTGGARVTELPVGPCLFFKREVFLGIGGYDERVFMYGEEEELFLKLSNQGLVCVYEPKAVVFHEGAASTGGKKRTGSFWLQSLSCISSYLYFRYYDDGPGVRILWWLFLFAISLGWTMITRDIEPTRSAFVAFGNRRRLWKRGAYRSHWGLRLLPKAAATMMRQLLAERIR